MNELETRMRQGEWFHSLTVPPNAWTVLRVDGRNFSRLTEQARYEKPFDEMFAHAMWQVALRLLKEFNGLYAYVESDEVSVLLPRSFDLFGRELEKLVSLSAATATGEFNRCTGLSLAAWNEVATFDSRAWVGSTDEDVVDYFLWRYDDAYRCAVNGWAYWSLRKEGTPASTVTSMLKGMRNAAKHELLFDRGVNVNDLPTWQKRGAALVWKLTTRTGHNPLTGLDVEVQRRVPYIETALPQSREDYRAMLRALVSGE